MTDVSPPSQDPSRLFRENWATYQKVIRGNYMFHRELTAAVIDQFDAMPASPLAILDLGCGDASQLAEILKTRQVAEYLGCDLSPFALELARHNLSSLGDRALVQCGDMLSLLRQTQPSRFDVVFSSFAVHHLSHDDKCVFFSECRRVLAATGCVILVDVMREEGETRQEYLDRYFAVAFPSSSLTEQDRSRIVEHARAFDFPETAATFQSMASASGLAEAKRLQKCSWHQAWCYANAPETCPVS